MECTSFVPSNGGPAINEPSDIIANILNALPLEQRTAIAKAILANQPVGPSLPVEMKASDDDKKKALATAHEAVNAANLKIAGMAARAAAHDQQVASVNAEMSALEMTEKILDKMAKELLAPITLQGRIVASNIVGAAERLHQTLLTLVEVQRKIEECHNKTGQLNMEEGVITTEMNVAQEALAKAQTDLKKLQQ